MYFAVEEKQKVFFQFSGQVAPLQLAPLFETTRSPGKKNISNWPPL
jgi:hypothetical protein